MEETFMRVKKDSKNNDEKILDRFWFVTYVIVTAILFISAYCLDGDHQPLMGTYTSLAIIIYVFFPAYGPVNRIEKKVLEIFAKAH